MMDVSLKLGVVGLDGHGPVFVKGVNGSDGMLPGARVVAAMSPSSVMISPSELERNVEATRQQGVALVESPAELAGMVDGILILHDDGSRHLELASQLAGFRKPMFVDKPMEVGVASARALIDLCREARCPVFSASSLRFSEELQRCVATTEGNVHAAMTYSPFAPKPTMPGWVYYGIHAVEPLFRLMGCGCREVRCVDSAQGPVAVGTWRDGRLGVAKGIVGGPPSFGFTVWSNQATTSTVVDASRIYRALLGEIKRFIETGQAPVAPEESIEVIAFMVAANESMRRSGEPVALPTGARRS